MRKLLKMLALLSIVGCFSLILFACGEPEAVDDSPITQDEISELYTSPDSFKGRTYEFTAQVLEVEESGGVQYIQAWKDIKNYDKNTIIVWNDASEKFSNEDYIKVVGTIDGQFTGENALGTSVTAPQITASSVEKITAVEAFPAKKTVEVDKTVEKGEYKATVKKIDFTDSLTRVYVTVTNDSSSDFDVYPDQGVVIQDGQQHGVSDDSYIYGYFTTPVRAGASADGVITFDKLEEKDFKYTFNGYDNDNYEELDFSFDISVE